MIYKHVVKIIVDLGVHKKTMDLMIIKISTTLNAHHAHAYDVVETEAQIDWLQKYYQL